MRYNVLREYEPLTYLKKPVAPATAGIGGTKPPCEPRNVLAVVFPACWLKSNPISLSLRSETSATMTFQLDLANFFDRQEIYDSI